MGGHRLNFISDRRSITYEKFSVLLIQIEAILNSCPLYRTIFWYRSAHSGAFPHKLLAFHDPGTFLDGRKDHAIIPLAVFSADHATVLAVPRKFSEEPGHLEVATSVTQISLRSLVLWTDYGYPSKWPLEHVIQTPAVTHPGVDGLICVIRSYRELRIQKTNCKTVSAADVGIIVLTLIIMFVQFSSPLYET